MTSEKGEKMAETFDYIYEDEMTKLVISVDGYVSQNNSKGVTQMKGRRFGDMWERLIKSAFETTESSDIGDRVYYQDYVDKWIDDNAKEIENDCCRESAKKLLMKFIEETTGTSNQDMCDFTFKHNGVKYAVDTKYRFHSNDAKTVREIANSAYHLKYMGYEPVLLMRTKREDSIATAINRFETAGWSIKCDTEASNFISDFAGDELNKWLDKNVDVWQRLKKYHDGLRQLRFGDAEEWKF